MTLADDLGTPAANHCNELSVSCAHDLNKAGLDGKCGT